MLWSISWVTSTEEILLDRSLTPPLLGRKARLAMVTGGKRGGKAVGRHRPRAAKDGRMGRVGAGVSWSKG
uniref:Uncharacterized protein n=1 Tax=Arundo donax TaxID=35708 RepID=A0A0A8Y3Q7_ARUDO